MSLSVQSLRKYPASVLELLLTLAEADSLARAQGHAGAVTYAYLMGKLELEREAVFARVLKAKRAGLVVAARPATKGGRGAKQAFTLTELGRSIVGAHAERGPKAPSARG